MAGAPPGLCTANPALVLSTVRSGQWWPRGQHQHPAQHLPSRPLPLPAPEEGDAFPSPKETLLQRQLQRQLQHQRQHQRQAPAPPCTPLPAPPSPPPLPGDFDRVGPVPLVLRPLPLGHGRVPIDPAAVQEEILVHLQDGCGQEQRPWGDGRRAPGAQRPPCPPPAQEQDAGRGPGLRQGSAGGREGD